MLNIRFHPMPNDPPPSQGRDARIAGETGPSASRTGKFHVLLTEDRSFSSRHWTDQLPRLLEPQGVVSHLVQTAQDAAQLLQRTMVHAAVIDLATPMGETGPTAGQQGGGLWLIEQLRRQPNPPAVVVIHDTTYSHRLAERVLRESLRLGAFSVVNKPVQMEQLLTVFQRLLDRQYRGQWPPP